MPMGYRVEDRKLLVEEAEAATVRLIFERYLVLGSLPALRRELRQMGILTRPRAMASGGIRGRRPDMTVPVGRLTLTRELGSTKQAYRRQARANVNRPYFHPETLPEIALRAIPVQVGS